MVPENKANFRRDCVVAVVAVAVGSAHRPVTADLKEWLKVEPNKNMCY